MIYPVSLTCRRYITGFPRSLLFRITPVYPMTMIKSNSVEDIELHGVTIPKDSMIGFDPYRKIVSVFFVVKYTS